ncbi:MAG: HAMP domain-containing protein [Pseudomonadota bacterium]
MVLGVAGGIVLSLFGLLRPLRNIVATLRRLTDGDLSVEVANADRADEIGDLARAVNGMKQQILLNQTLSNEATRQQLDKERRSTAMAQLNEGFSVAFKEVGVGIVQSSIAVDTDSNTLSTGAQRTREQASWSRRHRPEHPETWRPWRRPPSS